MPTEPRVLDAIERRLCSLIENDSEVQNLVRYAVGDSEDLPKEGARVIAQACEEISQRLHRNRELFPERPVENAKAGQYL